jgi:hypothetical protein
MKFSPSFGARWIAPAVLSAAALAVLVAVPVIAGPKTVTQKSLTQQSNAKYIHIQGPLNVDDDSGFDYNDPQVVLPLSKGNYVFSATFRLSKPGASGLVVICRLGTNVVSGNKFDAVDFFGVGDYESASLASASKLTGNGTVKLACADGSIGASDSTISDIDITATEVPKLQTIFQ